MSYNLKVYLPPRGCVPQEAFHPLGAFLARSAAVDVSGELGCIAAKFREHGDRAISFEVKSADPEVIDGVIALAQEHGFPVGVLSVAIGEEADDVDHPSEMAWYTPEGGSMSVQVSNRTLTPMIPVSSALRLSKEEIRGRYVPPEVLAMLPERKQAMVRGAATMPFSVAQA